MHVAHANALFVHIFGQVFGHSLGQGRDQRAVAIGGNLAHLVQQVIHLHLDGPDFDLGIQQAGRADDLFGENAARLFDFPRGGGGGNKDRLRPHGIPFLELERAVVHAGRQAEPVFGQRELAAVVAFVHSADLRHRDMAFIGKDDGVVGDEFKKGGRRFAGGAARQVAGIVLDAVADAGRLQHLQIEVGALFEPLCFQQFAFTHQLIEPAAQLFLDADDRLLHRGLRRHVVAVGIDTNLIEGTCLFARERIEFGDAFQFLAEEGESPCPVFKVGGKDFKTVTAHPETATLERRIVPLVLLGHEIRDDPPLIVGAADFQVLRHGAIGFHRTDAVDTGNRSHDDHVVPLQKRTGGGVAHPVDLFVDLAFLLDIGV